MYNVKSVFEKNPIQISGAVMSVFNLLVVAGVIGFSEKVVASANTSLILVLGLFITTQTANRAVLDEIDADTE